MVCFALKTVGKTRGYIERSEVTGRDGKDLAAGPAVVIVDK